MEIPKRGMHAISRGAADDQPIKSFAGRSGKSSFYMMMIACAYIAVKRRSMAGKLTEYEHLVNCVDMDCVGAYNKKQKTSYYEGNEEGKIWNGIVSGP